MNESPPHPRPSSGRRRPNRPSGKANKAYLSENDMSGQVGLGYEDADGPQTPQKSASGSPAPGYHHGSGQRAKNNRPRPKTVAVSPESTPFDRKTPPLTASAIKPASATAFAGATFHASPAPSALPMPSFMTKYNPDSPQPKSSKKPSLDQYTSNDELEQPTPQRPAPASARESPLEVIFRADRAEKERARRASSANSMSAVFQSGAPPSHPSPGLSRGAAAGNVGHPHLNSPPWSGGIPPNELDGTPGQPFGPAFSTPYHERIRASKANAFAPANVGTAPQRATAEDRSEALKRFLGVSSESATVPTGMAQPSQLSSRDQHPNGTSADGKAGTQRSADIVAMEDDLRRILKIRS